MRIKFIAKILEDLNNLSSVSYVFIGRNMNETVSFTQAILKQLLSRNISSFQMHRKAFVKAYRVVVTLAYASGESKVLTFKTPTDLVWSPEPPKQTLITFNDKNVRVNKKSPYQNTQEHRQMVISNVKAMCDEVQDIEDESQRGFKNLVYFTVFGQGYIDLLDMCLQSIDANTIAKDFDVLIIADAESQQLINSTCNLSNFNVHFMTVDKPLDGIDASKNKCRIFDWININQYNKILFLDCDIISLKDINAIFEREYQPHKLYTVYNPRIATHAVDSVYHSVTRATEDEKQIYIAFNQRPFNAGQFLMINSVKMRQHFDNVKWFMENWPGEYFFEQAFMVEYFCRNALTICDAIQNDVNIALIPSDKEVKMMHDENTILIHFAGPALDHQVKKEYISNYKNAYLS